MHVLAIVDLDLDYLPRSSRPSVGSNFCLELFVGVEVLCLYLR